MQEKAMTWTCSSNLGILRELFVGSHLWHRVESGDNSVLHILLQQGQDHEETCSLRSG